MKSKDSSLIKKFEIKHPKTHNFSIHLTRERERERV